MPLYRYTCENENCGSLTFEKIRPRSSKKADCPDCGQKGKREKFSSYTIKFEGSGFYQTDYNDKSYQ